MKNTPSKLSLFLIITIISICSSDFAFSSEYPCIEQASTIEEVISCGNGLVPQLEADIELEFKRLFDKFKNSKEMQKMLEMSKNSWRTTQNLQCRTEELIADNGKMLAPRTIEAEKAFLRCLLRMLTEQKNALSKL